MKNVICHAAHVIFHMSYSLDAVKTVRWLGGGNQGGGWGRGGGRRQGLIFPLRMRSAGIYIYIYMGMISSQNVSKECCTISKSMPEHLKSLPVHYSFPCQNGLENKLQT